MAIDQDGVHFSLANVDTIAAQPDLTVLVTFRDGREARRCGPFSCGTHADYAANALAMRSRG